MIVVSDVVATCVSNLCIHAGTHIIISQTL